MPAKGRNNGAREAKGDFYFFFDADVILQDDFLQKAYTEMQERFLDLATCEMIPLSDLHIDKILHNLVNFSIRMNQYANPHAAGFCILSTKRLFERTGGFDESLTMAEDHDFVKRASKFRPLRLVESTQISVSVRRLEKEGRTALIRKYLEVEWHRIFKGELKTEIIEYEFGNFKQQSLKKITKRIAEFNLSKNRVEKNPRKKRHRSMVSVIPPNVLIKKFKSQFAKTKESLAAFFYLKKQSNTA
jgi:glycosyltransferase involved in cell wall biosynthesis